MRVLKGPLAVVGVLLWFGTLAAAQADGEATELVGRWVEAVMSADPARLDEILAPEFQIQREDGSAHGKADYIAEGLSSVSARPDIVDVVATRTDDIMVVRYVLVIDATVDGRAMQARAPRLTVFRKEGERWLVVAHANFARIANQAPPAVAGQTR